MPDIDLRWEYRLVSEAAFGFLGGKLDMQAATGKFNELGRQGWELVNVFDTNYNDGGTRDVVAVFKRPLPRAASPDVVTPAVAETGPGTRGGSRGNAGDSAREDARADVRSTRVQRPRR